MCTRTHQSPGATVSRTRWCHTLHIADESGTQQNTCDACGDQARPWRAKPSSYAIRGPTHRHIPIGGSTRTAALCTSRAHLLRQPLASGRRRSAEGGPCRTRTHVAGKPLARHRRTTISSRRVHHPPTPPACGGLCCGLALESHGVARAKAGSAPPATAEAASAVAEPAFAVTSGAQAACAL